MRRYFDLKLDSLGLDSPFMQGMTSRRLDNGTLRILSLTLHGVLIEYEPAPCVYHSLSDGTPMMAMSTCSASRYMAS